MNNMTKSIAIWLSLAIIIVVSMYASNAYSDVGWAHLNQFHVLQNKVPNEIRVMVIDTGIGDHRSLNRFVQNDGSDHYIDRKGHGTHVAGIILYGNRSNAQLGMDTKDQVCENVKLFSCKYYDPTKIFESNIDSSIRCVRLAIELKIDVINYSGGGESFSKEEYLAYTDFIKTDGLVVAAAGNDKNSLEQTMYYPASYAFDQNHLLKNVAVVQNRCSNGELCESSNRHPAAMTEDGEKVFSTLPDNQYGYLTGTSQAAPEYLHKLLKLKCQTMKAE